MNNALTAQKQKFSVAITTEGYRNLINNTLGDPERSKRFVAAITSAVAVNPMLQECTPGTILAGGLLGESLNLSPSPQLGQYYLVPFKDRVKGKDGKVIWMTDEQGNKIKDENGKYLHLYGRLLRNGLTSKLLHVQRADEEPCGPIPSHVHAA